MYKNCSAVNVNAASGNTWEWKENVFDGSPAWTYYGQFSYSSDNGYLNTSNRILPNSSEDVLPSSFTWMPGAYGNYYQQSTSPFSDVGSRTATSAGLVHFTAGNNNQAETGNVDIGLHYPALPKVCYMGSEAARCRKFWEPHYVLNSLEEMIAERKSSNP